MTDFIEDQVVTDETEMDTSEPTDGRRQRAAKAPYMSYAGFRKLLNTLRDDGVPGRFDKSYFSGQSGSLIAQTRGTLRYFDLIDDEQNPTDQLTKLVGAVEGEYKVLLRRLFEAGYTDALALNPNATVGQLADVFRRRGLSGATVQKAIGFFVSMAEDVGIEVSPLFKKGRVAASTGNGSRKKRTKTVQQPPPVPPNQGTQHPRTPSAGEQKAAYIAMLMELAKENDSSVQEGLLDRIEKALGIDSTAPQTREPDLPREE